jgi:hypothetical protein
MDHKIHCWDLRLGNWTCPETSWDLPLTIKRTAFTTESYHLRPHFGFLANALARNLNQATQINGSSLWLQLHHRLPDRASCCILPRYMQSLPAKKQWCIARKPKQSIQICGHFCVLCVLLVVDGHCREPGPGPYNYRWPGVVVVVNTTSCLTFLWRPLNSHVPSTGGWKRYR